MLSNFETIEIIAGYAAIVATLSLVISTILAINEFRKSRREISIYVADTWIRGRRHGFEKMVAVNVGLRPITIIETGFLDNGGEKIPPKYPPQDVDLPHTMNPGESFEWHFNLSERAIQSDWKVFVSNAKGKSFSAPVGIDS